MLNPVVHIPTRVAIKEAPAGVRVITLTPISVNPISVFYANAGSPAV